MLVRYWQLNDLFLLATSHTATCSILHLTVFMFFHLGSNTIRVDWDAPALANGRISQYLIYLSYNSSSPGAVVYNSSDTFLTYTLTNLTGGVQYFVRVAVSLLSFPSILVIFKLFNSCQNCHGYYFIKLKLLNHNNFNFNFFGA